MGKWQITDYSKFILKPHFHEAAFKIKIPCIESSVFDFFFLHQSGYKNLE